MDKEMLQGKVAIITGGSYRMGQTMAELSPRKGRPSSSPPGDRKNWTKWWKASGPKAAGPSA